jgi:hypothetical protein
VRFILADAIELSFGSNDVLTSKVEALDDSKNSDERLVEENERKRRRRRDDGVWLR